MPGETDTQATENDAIEHLMISLRKEFLAKLPAKFFQMRAALVQYEQQYGQNDESSTQAIHTLFYLLHSLGGSAGSFGFIALGQHASQLEQKMRTNIFHDYWSTQALLDISEGICALEEQLSWLTQPEIAPDASKP